jgi:hypothetical protein
MHPDLVEYGPIRFHSDPNALYDRHLVLTTPSIPTWRRHGKGMRPWRDPFGTCLH